MRVKHKYILWRYPSDLACNYLFFKACRIYHFILVNAFSPVNVKRLINSLLLYTAVYLLIVIILPLLINIA